MTDPTLPTPDPPTEKRDQGTFIVERLIAVPIIIGFLIQILGGLPCFLPMLFLGALVWAAWRTLGYYITHPPPPLLAHGDKFIIFPVAIGGVVDYVIGMPGCGFNVGAINGFILKKCYRSLERPLSFEDGVKITAAGAATGVVNGIFVGMVIEGSTWNPFSLLHPYLGRYRELTDTTDGMTRMGIWAFSGLMAGTILGGCLASSLLNRDPPEPPQSDVGEPADGARPADIKKMAQTGENCGQS